MPNYYTSYSFIIPEVAMDELKWWMELTTQTEDGADTTELKAKVGEDCDLENWPDFEWSHSNSDPSGNHLWIHSDEFGNLENICGATQAFLKKFRPKGAIAIGVGYSCSKPHMDAYGGSAFVVTANEIRSIHTGEWLRQQQKDLEKQGIKVLN